MEIWNVKIEPKTAVVIQPFFSIYQKNIKKMEQSNDENQVPTESTASDETTTTVEFDVTTEDPQRARMAIEIPDEPEDDEEEDDDPDEEEEGDGEGDEKPKFVRIETSFLGEIVDVIDDFKADICWALSGDEKKDKYLNPKEKRARFTKSLDKYLGDIDYKISPHTSFFIACLIFFAPSALLAFNQKRKNKNKKIEAQKQAQLQSESPATTTSPQTTTGSSDTNANPFETTPEFVTKRRKFDTHANGCYKFTPAGEYQKAEDATEQPSQLVKILLDRKKTAAEIKNILGYE